MSARAWAVAVAVLLRCAAPVAVAVGVGSGVTVPEAVAVGAAVAGVVGVAVATGSDEPPQTAARASAQQTINTRVRTSSRIEGIVRGPLRSGHEVDREGVPS